MRVAERGWRRNGGLRGEGVGQRHPLGTREGGRGFERQRRGLGRRLCRREASGRGGRRSPYSWASSPDPSARFSLKFQEQRLPSCLPPQHSGRATLPGNLGGGGGRVWFQGGGAHSGS